MPIESPIRVLVVDDHVAIRTGISQLVDAEPTLMCSVGPAATAGEALAQARASQPHVVVLDVDLGGEDGLALIPALQRAAPCAVVVLTCLTDPHVAARAHQLGASACLHKAAPAAELMACILAAHRGDPHDAAGHPANAGGAMSCATGANHPPAEGKSSDGNGPAGAYSEAQDEPITRPAGTPGGRCSEAEKRRPLTGVEQVSKVFNPAFKRVGQKPATAHFSTTATEETTMKLVQFVKSFIREEDGAAAIEYGLIAALIAIAIIAGAALLGTSLNGLFLRLGACMATPNITVCGAVLTG